MVVGLLRMFVIVVTFNKYFGMCKDSFTPIFRFSCWDFETILKTTAFIDRSLLLRTMMEKEESVLIIAPRLSGKSTNLNMARRFLEIDVDGFGRKRERLKTLNYKLFVENNLKIVQCKHFFQKHFGNHPVIFLDYHPLSAVENFNSLLEQYREILLNSFQSHEYLKNNMKLWLDGSSKERFTLYCRKEGYWSLSQSEIKKGIPLLSKLLYEHFGRKVYILMDEYDAIIDSPFLRDSPDKNQIISFIREVNRMIFKDNEYVFHSFVNGVTRYRNSSRLNLFWNETLPDNFVEYNFQTHNPFNQYYGVNADELHTLLNRFIKDTTKISDIKNEIAEKSEIIYPEHKLYNTWFILRYLANLNETYVQC